MASVTRFMVAAGLPHSLFQKLCTSRLAPLTKCLAHHSTSPSCSPTYCARITQLNGNHFKNFYSKNVLSNNSFQSCWANLCLHTNRSLIVVNFRTFTTSSRCYINPRPQNRMNQMREKNRTVMTYVVAAFVFMIGVSYAGVPLYKMFCQATGLGGTVILGHDVSKIEDMEAVDRQIKVRFNADTAATMRWSFKPQQSEIVVSPGETALAFYTAKNPTDKPIIGISTYNVIPLEAGPYFNKIQCFCFEEQRLNPNEQVDMPVFFYIDPEFDEDPKLENCDTIVLSYTFFQATEGLSLPLPGYPQPHNTTPA